MSFKLDGVTLLTNCDPNERQHVAHAADELETGIRDLAGRGNVLTKRDRRSLKENSVIVYSFCHDNASKLTPEDQAKLRACAADLMRLSLDKLEEPFASEDYVRLVKTHMRAGKAFVDAGHDPSKADEYLSRATQFWQAAVDSNESFQEQHADLAFTLFGWKLEAAWLVNDRAVARNHALEACELLSLPKVRHEVYSFAMLLFNKAVYLYQHEEWDAAVEWLQTSSDALNRDRQVAKFEEKQARTLKVLSLCHIERKRFPQALAAIESSLELHACAEALLTRTRVLLQLKRAVQAEEALLKTLEHSECGIDMALPLCAEAGRTSMELCVKGLDLLARKFPRRDEVLVQRLRCLLKLGDGARAGEFVEALASEHHSGKRTLQQGQTLDDMCALLWNHAVGFFERTELGESIKWLVRYRQLLQLRQPSSAANLASCARALSISYFDAQRFDDALNEAQRAVDHEPGDPTAQLLLVRSMMKRNAAGGQPVEDKRLMVELTALMKNPDRTSDHLVVLVSDAKKHDALDVAVEALAALYELSRSGEDAAMDTGELLQNVVQCCLLRAEEQLDEDARRTLFSRLAKYSGFCVQFFRELREAERGTAERQKMMRWFAGATWNGGIEAATAKEYAAAATLFYSSSALFALVAATPEDRNYERLAALMGSNCALEQCWTLGEEERRQRAKAALATLQKCKTQCEQYSDAHNANMCTVLICKARLFSGDPDLPALVNRLYEQQRASAAMFETVAALAAEQPFERHDVCVTATEAALRIHLAVAANKRDWPRIAQHMRTLAQLTPRSASAEVIDNLASQLLAATLDTKSGAAARLAGEYPRREAQWLVSRIWNEGVVFYRQRSFKKAEKLMSAALQLHKFFLSEVEPGKLDALTDSYAFVLECVQRDGSGKQGMQVV